MDTGRSTSTKEKEKEKGSWGKREKSAMIMILIFNFMCGIIKDGLAPLVSVYLVSVRGWNPGTAGIIWMIRELSMVVSLVPIGDFIDKTTKKKTLLIIATFVAALCSNILIITDNFWVLAIKSVLEGVAASALDPGKTGITLGITGQERFEKQSSKNEIANHSGYLFFAGVIGIFAYFIYPNTQWLFITIGIAGLISVVCIYLIPRDLIKDDVARNIVVDKNRTAASDGEAQNNAAVNYCVILRDLSIMMLVFSIFTFHLANAAVLPLVGQVIANEGGRDGLTFATICIIVARLVSISSAWFAGKYSPKIGYRLVLCIGYVSLTLRCLSIVLISLYINNPRFLTFTQILDGIGNGIVNLMLIILTKILTEGTGRFNVTFGLCHVAWMMGSSFSNLLAGFVAHYYSYTLAFIVLGGISFVPMISTVFGIKEPEKRKEQTTVSSYSSIQTTQENDDLTDDGGNDTVHV